MKANNFEIWDILIHDLFIHTFSFHDIIVNKPNFHWTEEDKRKMTLGFKVKNLLINALSSKKFCYIFNYYPGKEVRDTLEMIH